MPSPTQRSLKMLRDQGFTCEITERFNPFTKTRHDLFNFADLIAIRADHPPLLVQVTSSGWASRVKKVCALEAARTALQCGMLIQVHGWRKLKSNRGRWTPKIIDITEADLCPPSP